MYRPPEPNGSIAKRLVPASQHTKMAAGTNRTLRPPRDFVASVTCANRPPETGMPHHRTKRRKAGLVPGSPPDATVTPSVGGDAGGARGVQASGGDGTHGLRAVPRRHDLRPGGRR